MEMSFEKAIERLEEVVRLLESGEAELEKSMQLYEEGISLVRICNKLLEDTEAKIKLLGSGEEQK